MKVRGLGFGVSERLVRGWLFEVFWDGAGMEKLMEVTAGLCGPFIVTLLGFNGRNPETWLHFSVQYKRNLCPMVPMWSGKLRRA